MGSQWWRPLVEGTDDLGQQIGATWNIMCISATRGGYAFQVRIQDLVKGGAPASEAENCWRSKAELRERSEQSVAGVQGPLKGPRSLWVFNAQICILIHSRDSFSLIFDIFSDTKCW